MEIRAEFLDFVDWLLAGWLNWKWIARSISFKNSWLFMLELTVCWHTLVLSMYYWYTGLSAIFVSGSIKPSWGKSFWSAQSLPYYGQGRTRRSKSLSSFQHRRCWNVSLPCLPFPLIFPLIYYNFFFSPLLLYLAHFLSTVSFSLSFSVVSCPAFGGTLRFQRAEYSTWELCKNTINKYFNGYTFFIFPVWQLLFFSSPSLGYDRTSCWCSLTHAQLK